MGGYNCSYKHEISKAPNKKIGPEINPGPIGWVKSVVDYPV